MFTPFPPSLFSANEKKMRTYHQNGNPSDDYTLVSSGVTGCWGDIWIYDGPRTTWYANGQLRSSVQYEYGRLEGQQVEWYKNGQKKGEYNFKKGKADGFTTIWYENGQKKVEGTCTNGMPDGLWSGWSPDGKQHCGKIYKDGNLDKTDTWSYDDELRKFECTYRMGEKFGHVLDNSSERAEEEKEKTPERKHGFLSMLFEGRSTLDVSLLGVLLFVLFIFPLFLLFYTIRL